jgi:hypothetical protein
MSSLIHTFEMLSSVVGTWRRLVGVLKGIALTSRRESAFFRPCHCLEMRGAFVVKSTTHAGI